MGLLSDIAAVALDPTSTTLAAKKGIEKIVEVTVAEGQAAETISETPAGVERKAPEAAIKVCCNEYQIQDDFLLNTKTGAVWKYDKNSNSFKLVTKEETDLQRAARGLIYTLAVEEWHAAKAKESATLHHTVRKDFEDKFGTMIKLLDAKVKELVPRSGSTRRK